MIKKAPKTWEAKRLLEKHREFVVFDLETTGLSADRGDRIIEIGAVHICDDVVVDTFSQLINPHRHLPREIIQITRITDAMLYQQPEYQEILPEFKRFIGNKPLVAHNASFDMRFLTYYCNKIDRPVTNNHIDTIPLLKELYPNLSNYKLGTIHEFFQFDEFDHHRALDDAQITAKIFVKIQEGFGLLGIGEANEYILNLEKRQRLREKYLRSFEH